MMTNLLPPATQAAVIRNRTFDQIAIGDSVSLERTLSYEDIELFAIMSGDVNPQHVDPQYAAASRFHGVIAHGMWGAALISALLGTRLPGPGTIYRSQTLRFMLPVRVGDTLTIRVTVTARDEQKKLVTFACTCTNQDGKNVIEGEAEVVAPTEPVERARPLLPALRLDASGGLKTLLDQVAALGPVRVALVYPCDAASLGAALEARARGLITPLLVAPRSRLEALAAGAGLDLSGIAIEDVAHSAAAAARAVELAARGDVEALLQGSLESGELMAALRADAGCHLSHCILVEAPAYPRPFIITDCAAPALEEQAAIVRNAIGLAHGIGIGAPHVAILAPAEAPDPATQEASALRQMAECGQISGAVLDAPLAFERAALVKGAIGALTERADVLVAPDLDSAALLARQIEHSGDAVSIGLVLGARVPVILSGPADPRASRVAGCAMALLLAHQRRPDA